MVVYLPVFCVSFYFSYELIANMLIEIEFFSCIWTLSFLNIVFELFLSFFALNVSLLIIFQMFLHV